MTDAEPPAGAPRPQADGPTRSTRWACDGPAEIELHLGAGAARVELTPGGTTLEITIETGRGGWRRGLADVLAALGGPPDDRAVDVDLAAQALADTTVDGSGEARRLVVRSPRTGPGRRVAMAVSVVAPAGSQVLVRTGSASAEITGPVGRVDVGTGAGRVTLPEVTGRAQVRTGSGDVRTGHLRGGGAIRTGAGDVAVDSVSGELDVLTTSGTVRVGIARGTLAELDLHSGSGRTRSELTVLTQPGDEAATARVHVRSVSGDVVVRAAPV